MSNTSEALADLEREFARIAADLALHAAAIADLSQRVQALEVPVPNPDILWKWDAVALEPFGIHAKDPSRVIFTQAGGRNAVRLQTLPGDDHVFGSNDAERCDLRLPNDVSDATEGREWWIKLGVWFPDDYVDQPSDRGWNWGAVFNYHDDADTPGSQGPLQLVTFPRAAAFPDWPTGMHFQIFGGAPGGTALGDSAIGSIERNRWYDFVFHIRWSSTAGLCDGWVNGRQFIAHKGPTLITGHGAYLKLSNYHMAHGLPSAILYGRITVARTEAGLA